MIAVVLTEGATSPGSQDRSDAITVSGYLMPWRPPTLATFDIWTAPYSRSAGCAGGARRSSCTVICGMVSTSWRRKSICEPCISPAIMIVKPTPIATPAMPTSVWRTRAVTWVQAISKSRFAVMACTSAICAIFGIVAPRVVHNGIDMRGNRSRDHGTVRIGRRHGRRRRAGRQAPLGHRFGRSIGHHGRGLHPRVIDAHLGAVGEIGTRRREHLRALRDVPDDL